MSGPRAIHLFPATTMFPPPFQTLSTEFISNSPPDNPGALGGPLVIDESWYPSSYITAKLDFANICFKGGLSGWKKKYPNPADSPAERTRILCFLEGERLTDEDVDWIKQFTNLEKLEVQIGRNYNGELGRSGCFSPFDKIPPATLESLTVCYHWHYLSLYELFKFICFFPGLKDLHILSSAREIIVEATGTHVDSLVLPALTGTFVLEATLPDPVVRTLLEAKNGCRFSKIVQKQDSYFRNPESNKLGDLVKMCSGTLSCLYISFRTSAK